MHARGNPQQTPWSNNLPQVAFLKRYWAAPSNARGKSNEKVKLRVLKGATTFDR